MTESRESSKKIIILHVLDSLDCGGIQSFLLNIYKNIDREKIQFDFLLSYHGVHDDDFIKLGSRLHFIPNIKDVGYLEYVKAMRVFLRNHPEYKIVHIHYSQLTGLVSMIAHNEGVKCIISHSHSSSMQSKGKTALFKKILQKGVFHYPDYYLACSSSAADFLFQRKSRKAKIIKNGIDLREYSFNEKDRKIIRTKLGIGDDAVLIGHVGRMDRVKNQAFLVEVFCELHKKWQNAYLLLIGEGAEKKNIESKVSSLKLNDNVFFLGNLSDCSRYYSAMDLFVFPSISEGLGISLIEAQANGLVCFASSVIPREADATGKVSFISLEKSADFWAKRIINTDLTRYDGFETLKKNGYDVKDSARELQDFYFEINNNDCMRSK